MIVTVKNENDFVIAYMESRQVGQSGFDKFRGEYLWINELWIHSSFKNAWEIYRNLMNQTLFKAMDAKWVYFRRNKYNGRVSKLYNRERLMNILEKGMAII